MLDSGRSVILAVAVLLTLVVGSALVLVYNSYLNRQLFISLSDASRAHTELRVEFGRLQLEYGTWTSPAFIEKVAVEKLHMRLPETGQVVLVPEQLDAFSSAATRYANSGRLAEAGR